MTAAQRPEDKEFAASLDEDIRDIKRGRPRLDLSLVAVDQFRAAGMTWGAIAREMGVSRNGLLAARGRHDVPRGAPLDQRKVVRGASRFLRANLGEGLTPVEFKDAKSFARLLELLHTDNARLRESLSKARRQIRDLERALAR